ncbi:hypothetical protein GGR61_000634 [Xanthomonas arboricola]|nr:hypothetical protein [Xanthomonas sp. 3058]
MDQAPATCMEATVKDPATPIPSAQHQTAPRPTPAGAPPFPRLRGRCPQGGWGQHTNPPAPERRRDQRNNASQALRTTPGSAPPYTSRRSALPPPAGEGARRADGGSERTPPPQIGRGQPPFTSCSPQRRKAATGPTIQSIARRRRLAGSQRTSPQEPRTGVTTRRTAPPFGKKPINPSTWPHATTPTARPTRHPDPPTSCAGNPAPRFGTPRALALARPHTA